MKISLLVTAVWAARIAGEEGQAETEAPSFSLLETAADGQEAAGKPSKFAKVLAALGLLGSARGQDHGVQSVGAAEAPEHSDAAAARAALGLSSAADLRQVQAELEAAKAPEDLAHGSQALAEKRGQQEVDAAVAETAQAIADLRATLQLQKPTPEQMANWNEFMASLAKVSDRAVSQETEPPAEAVPDLAVSGETEPPLEAVPDLAVSQETEPPLEEVVPDLAISRETEPPLEAAVPDLAVSREAEPPAEVVPDLAVSQEAEPGQTPGMFSFSKTVTKVVDGKRVTVQSKLVRRPDGVVQEVEKTSDDEDVQDGKRLTRTRTILRHPDGNVEESETTAHEEVPEASMAFPSFPSFTAGPSWMDWFRE